MMTTMTCRECARTFDMLDEDDAGEWAFGHDCEPPPPEPTLVTDPRNDPHMHRNMNGSWNCDRCQMLVILFDDDQHDCTGRPWWLEQPDDQPSFDDIEAAGLDGTLRTIDKEEP